MSEENYTVKRFIGLDIHKHYFVAVGVDPARQVVYGPYRGRMDQLERWAQQEVTQQDALVLEMTTNSYSVYDTLRSGAHSVTVVHPPQVGLIVGVPVKTDKKAALTLAQLHAAGLLRGIWVPPEEVRELRALLAHRSKMVRLSTIAKNRLQAVLHRHSQEPPAGNLFGDEQQAFWAALALRPLERHCLEADRATLAFAQAQIQADEACLKALAAQSWPKSKGWAG